MQPSSNAISCAPTLAPPPHAMVMRVNRDVFSHSVCVVRGGISMNRAFGVLLAALHEQDAEMGDFDTSGENTMHQEQGFTSMAPVSFGCRGRLLMSFALRRGCSPL